MVRRALIIVTGLVAAGACWLLVVHDAPGADNSSTAAPAERRRTVLLPSSAERPAPGADGRNLGEAEPLIRDAWPTGDRLASDRELAGIVVCATDGQPLDGIVIEAIGYDERMRETVVAGTASSGPDGTFRFETTVAEKRPQSLILHWDDDWTIADPGADESQGEAGRLLPSAGSGGATYQLDLADARDAPEALVVRLEPAWAAHGRIVDSFGVPLAGILVVGRAGRVRTDQGGVYRLASPRAAGPVEIFASRDEDLADLVSFLAMPDWLQEAAAHRRFTPIAAREPLDLGTMVVPDLPAWMR